MRKDVSLWLDLLRALASFAVFVAHIKLFGVATPDIAGWIPELGHDSVVLFFVLSGFVIAYTTDSRHANLKDYVTARAARLYSVAVPAILLTYTLAVIGVRHAPDGYEDSYQLGKLWLYVPFELGFFGELWMFSEPPCSNVPWWSLGYEAWYYLLFALLTFYRGTRRFVLLALGLAFVGFKLWLLAPIWGIGALLWRNRDRVVLTPTTARVLMAASVVGYVAYKLSGLEAVLSTAGNVPFGGTEKTPLGSAQNWLHDYVVAVFAVIHLHALGHAHLQVPTILHRSIRYFASFTFSLYLMHAPLLLFARNVFDYDRGNAVHVAAIACAVLVAVMVLGTLTEHRKEPYRRVFDRMLTQVGRWVRSTPIVSRVLVPNA
ncbi:MAG: acyltransferase [Planctomycetota bacterium]